MHDKYLVELSYYSYNNCISTSGPKPVHHPHPVLINEVHTFQIPKVPSARVPLR